MLNVYPNPAQNYFVIENNSPLPFYTRIYDQTGRTMMSDTIIEASGTKTFEPQYPGLYYIIVLDLSGRLVMTRKVMLLHP